MKPRKFIYFFSQDLFGSNPCKHPIVFLKDIRIEDLKTVIDFIYRGEVNVSQERLQDVLKVFIYFLFFF